MSASVSLKDMLSSNTMVSAPELVERGSGDGLRCLACGHRCRVLPGRAGVCQVRFNEGGKLMAPAGYAAGVQVDPIEKKPFFHAYPARNATSFGMLGCDLHCSYCQNWITSQALRDDRANVRPSKLKPEKLVELAVEHNTPVMVSTYNEPLITADWAVEVFKLARQRDIVCGFVSNGNATPQVLEFIRPYVDLYKVDLKGFDDKRYRELGCVLGNVLETIELLVKMKFWVEVVTLVVPGFNDSDDELRRMAGFLVEVSPDIPWHVTAFRPDYKMTDRGPTPAQTLSRVRQLGLEAGLRYVYAGNLPGQLEGAEDTRCPDCDALLIQRSGFSVVGNRMRGDNCPGCGRAIPGVWEAAPPKRTEGWAVPLPVGL